MSDTIKAVCEILSMPYVEYETINTHHIHAGYETYDSTFVGEVSAITIDDIVRSRSSAWVKKVDVEINKLTGNYKGDRELENGDIYHPPISSEMLHTRFISYSEFSSLFSYTTSYEKHLQYNTFRAVQDIIENAPNFTSEYKNNLTGYTNFLARYSPPLRNFLVKKTLAYIPNSARKRHTYITGGSGSGKSELIKLLAYTSVRKNRTHRDNKRKRESLVVFDPHGDLAEQIGKFREHSKGVGLVYVDPRMKKGYSPTINPFDVQTDDQEYIELLTQEITKGLAEVIEGANFSMQMMSMLAPCVATIIRKHNGTIHDLQRFMDDENNHDLVELGKKSPNPVHKRFFESAFLTTRFKNTKDGVYTRLQFLLNSTVFSNFLGSKSTIDLAGEIDEGKTIIFNLSQGRIGEEVSHSIGKLLLSMIKAIGLRREDLPEHLRMTTHVVIDECQNFISPSIEKILAEARKYALHLTLAQQILGQGMDVPTRKIVLGNSAVKIVGSNSLDTLEKMAKETGTELDVMQSLTVGKFVVKVRDPKKTTPSFVLEVPPLLLNGKNDCKDWEAVKKEQLELYYRKLVTTTHSKEEQAERQTTQIDPNDTEEKQQDNRANRSRKAKFDI